MNTEDVLVEWAKIISFAETPNYVCNDLSMECIQDLAAALRAEQARVAELEKAIEDLNNCHERTLDWMIADNIEMRKALLLAWSLCRSGAQADELMDSFYEEADKG